MIHVCRYGPCDPEDLRDRMASAVATLGKDEVNDIIREEGKIEVTCEYVQLPCGSNGIDI